MCWPVLWADMSHPDAKSKTDLDLHRCILTAKHVDIHSLMESAGYMYSVGPWGYLRWWKWGN